MAGTFLGFFNLSFLLNLTLSLLFLYWHWLWLILLRFNKPIIIYRLALFDIGLFGLIAFREILRRSYRFLLWRELWGFINARLRWLIILSFISDDIDITRSFRLVSNIVYLNFLVTTLVFFYLIVGILLFVFLFILSFLIVPVSDVTSTNTEHNYNYDEKHCKYVNVFLLSTVNGFWRGTTGSISRNCTATAWNFELSVECCHVLLISLYFRNHEYDRAQQEQAWRRVNRHDLFHSEYRNYNFL